MPKVVAAHQPNYLPWIGFFHKILKSDTFIILDHVEFSKRGFINRNRVKGPSGPIWLTVPVKVHGRMEIREVPIENDKDWKRKHVSTLRSFYGKTPYFDELFPGFLDIYEREWEMLSDLNIALIRHISVLLGLDTEFLMSSEMDPIGKKMEMIIDLARKAGADIYLSGHGAMKYQDPEYFSENRIELVYQEFEHPVYPQRFGDFVPNLSIVDMLFNVGPERSSEILRGL